LLCTIEVQKVDYEERIEIRGVRDEQLKQTEGELGGQTLL
jgi:hypothetical protein